MNTPETEMLENVQGMDKCEKRAWLILLVVFALFMIGLIMVCFWGGPFEANSYWLEEKPPTFPN